MPTWRGRRAWPVLVAGVAALAAIAASRRWIDAVAVTGASMAPTLRAGDRLLVESLSFRRRRPRAGEIVLARDPRAPQRELVKRVAALHEETGAVELRGDATQASTDSRTFGAIPGGEITWRAALVYWPPGRAGLL